MADTKLVLKCGDIEVQCEGTEEFIKTELPKLIEGIARLREDAPEERGDASGKGGDGRKTPSDVAKWSISTFAQKLAVKKGPELVMAAALSLSLQGSDVFTKKTLRDRCR